MTLILATYGFRAGVMIKNICPHQVFRVYCHCHWRCERVAEIDAIAADGNKLIVKFYSGVDLVSLEQEYFYKALL